MKSSPPSTRPSINGSLAPTAETAPHNDDTAPSRRPTLSNNTSNNNNNNNASKSPRSVRFAAPTAAAAAEERDSRNSNVISPSGSFIVPDPEGGDLLFHAANPALRQEELPPFCLTREDVEAAFEFLDVNGSGILTMSNLKQRLSAFYPQLTSKEYKFLVEDPSGNNGVGGGGQNGSGEPSNPAQAFVSPFAVEGPKTDGAHAHGTGNNASTAKSAQNDSTGGGAPAESATAAPEAAPAVTATRAYGNRAGLDVDQLWDLIHSFQQLQLNFGAGTASAAAEPAHRPTASGGARRHGGAAATAAHPYDPSVAASLLHGGGGSGGTNGEGGFDAVGEAFRVYDPRATHYVEKEVLSRIMAQIGFGELNEEDLTLLVGTADFDGDGRISLDDFRRLVNMKGRFKKA